MQRICKYCNAVYSGDPGSTACPDCVKKLRATSMGARVCTDCGAAFIGGPSAKYCPSCRRIRKLETDRRHKRNGAKRPLGSTDLCQVCNQPYTVTGGLQKYCPNCAEAAIREKDRQQSRKWNAANTTPESRREERQAHTAELVCSVCGRSFRPHSAAITCSAACAKALEKRRSAEWEREHNAQRATYHNQRRKAAEAAMTPEEYKAYRDKINARARENYRKRKEKKQ